jgi:hypothetical protein
MRGAAMATKLAGADVRLPTAVENNPSVVALQAFADELRMEIAKISGVPAEKIAVEIVVDPPAAGAARLSRVLN